MKVNNMTKKKKTLSQLEKSVSVKSKTSNALGRLKTAQKNLAAFMPETTEIRQSSRQIWFPTDDVVYCDELPTAEGNFN